MLDAKLLPTFSKAASQKLTVYGTWIPRKGDNLRLTVEVVSNLYTVMSAALYQKNYNEVGNGSATAAAVTYSLTTGRQTMELLGAKELVRLVFELEPGGAIGLGVGLVQYRVLQPVWFEAVKA